MSISNYSFLFPSTLWDHKWSMHANFVHACQFCVLHFGLQGPYLKKKTRLFLFCDIQQLAKPCRVTMILTNRMILRWSSLITISISLHTLRCVRIEAKIYRLLFVKRKHIKKLFMNDQLQRKLKIDLEDKSVWKNLAVLSGPKIKRNSQLAVFKKSRKI